MVCLLCDFKILLTVFNHSYNCQTSHYLGRNWLPEPFLILPSLIEIFNFVIVRGFQKKKSGIEWAKVDVKKFDAGHEHKNLNFTTTIANNLLKNSAQYYKWFGILFWASSNYLIKKLYLKSKIATYLTYICNW